MKRRQFLVVPLAAILAGQLLSMDAHADQGDLTLIKDPNCGCCHAWAEAMKAAGFAVTIEDVDDLDAIKERFAVPAQVQGCHTAIVAGYYLEGHVPLDAVTRLLADRPAIAGLVPPIRGPAGRARG